MDGGRKEGKERVAKRGMEGKRVSWDARQSTNPNTNDDVVTAKNAEVFKFPTALRNNPDSGLKVGGGRLTNHGFVRRMDKPRYRIGTLHNRIVVVIIYVLIKEAQYRHAVSFPL